MSRKKRKLDDAEFIRIQNIFKKKNWPIQPTSTGLKESLFDVFCQMLGLLSKDEAKLVMDLTEDFIRYDIPYEHLIDEGLEYLLASSIGKSIGEYDAIIVTAVVPIGKSLNESGHSGPTVAYAVSQALPRFQAIAVKQQAKQIYLRPNPSAVKDLLQKSTMGRTLVIFVDDFSGTGSTVYNAMDFWIPQFQDLTSVDACALILVAMQEGIREIEKHGYTVFAARIHEKGITDSSRYLNKVASFQTMDTIENHLSVLPNNKYGYGHSEALVKMITTPDNTFPVFWHRKDGDGNPWPAPFKRYQIR